jgi:hypothetical protein
MPCLQGLIWAEIKRAVDNGRLTYVTSLWIVHSADVEVQELLERHCLSIDVLTVVTATHVGVDGTSIRVAGAQRVGRP